jgi:uncharacterized protein (TIGR03083 family)
LIESLNRIDVVPLFPEERAALLELLHSLTDEQWASPTVCTGWSVKDIAAHLVADDLGRLSHGRDGHRAARLDPQPGQDFDAALLDFINAQNDLWVAAARGFSPRTLSDLLAWSGRETQAYFESLDPEGPGLPVSWAGQSESPNWFDLAREYTERWHHQAQIREAVGAPMLYDERLFAAVIDTKAHAMPHALRGTAADEGAIVRLVVRSPFVRSYDVMRVGLEWRLGRSSEAPAAATVGMDADTFWRCFTRSIPRDEAVARAEVDGDPALAEAVFGSLAIIA